MRNNDIIMWYSVEGDYKPKGEVLARDRFDCVLCGYLSFDDEDGWLCESEGSKMYDVRYFIPISELMFNVKDEVK